MRYTIKTEALAIGVQSMPGRVNFQGLMLLPFEADMLGQALSECATHAETLAAESAATYIAKYNAKAA